MDVTTTLEQPSLIQTSKFSRISLWSPLPATPNQPLRIRVEHIEWPRHTSLENPSVISLQCVSTFPERYFPGFVGRSDADGGIREKREVLFNKEFLIDSGTIPLSSPHRNGKGASGIVGAFAPLVCDCKCHSRHQRNFHRADDVIEERYTRGDATKATEGLSLASSQEQGCRHCGTASTSDSLRHRRSVAASLCPPSFSVAHDVVEREAVSSSTSASLVDKVTHIPPRPNDIGNTAGQHPAAPHDPPLSSTLDSRPHAFAGSRRPKTFLPSVLPVDWESQRDAGIGLFGGFHIAIPSCFEDGKDILPTFQDTVQLDGRSGSVRCQVKSRAGSKTTPNIDQVIFRLVRTMTVLPPPGTTDTLHLPPAAGGNEQVIVFQSPNILKLPYHVETMVVASPTRQVNSETQGPVLRITVPPPSPPPPRHWPTAEQSVPSSPPVPLPLDDAEKLALLLYCATDAQIEDLDVGFVEESGSLRADMEGGMD
ncbi:hypothetical protein QFC21_002306 [Naganishia friedmannii]|uniref:Uncharacterized protein n=1 Tax=Naganishia friedmannii TaxID=89922 RepID=A0ACC2VXX4_9TREE|nr:hypothetical protein QFC21_002306 [Naganishia friedmannii]